MKRIETIKKVSEYGLVAVIRAESKDKAVRIIEAVKAGGIKVIEVTMTVPGAVDIIKELSEMYKNEDMIIGAGTVLDSETARLCILSGGKFIVGPHFDQGVALLCNRYRIPYLPGIGTVREAVTALEYGCEVIKVFPGNVYGPGFVKSLKGPLPQANFMPSGGVNLSNIKDWVKAGAVAVSTGSDLTAGAEKGNYDLVTETAAKFVEALKNARAEV